VIVNSPPQIEARIEAPKALSVTTNNRYSPNPFTVKVNAVNRGAQVGQNVIVTLALPAGLKFDGKSEAMQALPRLSNGEKKQLSCRCKRWVCPRGN